MLDAFSAATFHNTQRGNTYEGEVVTQAEVAVRGATFPRSHAAGLLDEEYKACFVIATGNSGRAMRLYVILSSSSRST